MSTALRLCDAFRLEHSRCALWLGLLESVSNGKTSLRASVAINDSGLPDVVGCFGYCLAMTDRESLHGLVIKK
ncbi:MAG: hypothetical protein K2N12_00300 [Helicobacter sp.]|nr:hypothetical protein [Helicobacter sp.]